MISLQRGSLTLIHLRELFVTNYAKFITTWENCSSQTMPNSCISFAQKAISRYWRVVPVRKEAARMTPFHLINIYNQPK